MNRGLRRLFDLRNRPEYADVDRLMLRFGMVAMVVLAPILFPGRHFVLYPVCGVLIMFVGRWIGFILHDRATAESRESAVVPQRGSAAGILLVIGVAVLLVSTLRFAWTTRDPNFMMQSFFGAVILCFCVGRYWARARVAMGLLDILLLGAALIFYCDFFRAGFLAAAVFAGLNVWHFLFRKIQPPTPSPI